MESNFGIGMVSLIGLLYTVGLLWVVFRYRRRSSASSWLLGGIVCLFVWHLFNTLFFWWPHVQTAVWLHQWKYWGACFLPVFYWFTAMAMTGHTERCKPRQLLGLSMVPFICALAAVTNPLHGLFFTQTTLLATEPVRVLGSEKGVLFYLFLFYSYALFGYTILQGVHSYRNAPLRYSRKITRLSVAFIIPVVVSLMVVLGVINSHYDVGLFAIEIAVTILVWAEYGRNSEGYLLTRNMVFDGLTSPIVVMDLQENVADMNRSARRLLPELPKGQKNLQFSIWMEEVTLQGDYQQEEDAGETFLVKKSQTLRVNRTPILTEDGQTAGTYVELVDVTAERILLQQMQRMATVDALTGLSNRSRYEREIARLGNMNELAFGCLVLDVNGLKHVNDTYGHKAGDNLLAAAADVIRRAIPDGTFAARTGGDEFAVLLENADEATMEACAQAIMQASAEQEPVNGWPVSLSLGWSLRAHGESANEVTLAADQAMYKSKQEFYEKADFDRRK